MVRHKPFESKWQALLDVTLVPAIARLPAAVPVERRNVATRHALLSRIYCEFEEMRGLSVTAGQAAKLFGIPSDVASRVLGQLTDAQVLRRRSDGQFALGGEEL
jgi:hypothetical protein